MELFIYGNKKAGFSGHGEHQPAVDPGLAPCPFCGSEDITLSNTHTPYYQAECEECGAKGPCPEVGGRDRIYKSEGATRQLHIEAFQAALDAWNAEAVRP